MRINDELMNLAWQVFTGWTLSSASQEMRDKIATSAKDLKSSLGDVDLNTLQLHVFNFYKQSITIDDFVGNMGRKSYETARKANLSQVKFYDIYLMAFSDYFLSQVYPKTTSFNHPDYSDEQRKKLSLEFVAILLADSLNPYFKAEMTELTLKNGQFEYIQQAFENSKFGHNLKDFCRNMPLVIRIFQLGGIDDTELIFSNFKLLMTYYFSDVRK